MSKEQFDIECKKCPGLQQSGDSYVAYSHKITLGAHWFVDRKVAVFADDRGTMIYSNYKIETPEQLCDALTQAKKEMDDALSTKTDDYLLWGVLNSAYENQRPEDK